MFLMKIDVLFRVSGFDESKIQNADALKKDIKNIVELIETLPEPELALNEEHHNFVHLGEDEYSKDAKKDQVLANCANVQKNMFTI